jgi:threonine/homoserine/homoserine lactone efflux protein
MAQVALVFCSINRPSVWTWAALGQLLRRWLARGERLRRFNRAMALLLLAFLWPVLMH